MTLRAAIHYLNEVAEGATDFHAQASEHAQRLIEIEKLLKEAAVLSHGFSVRKDFGGQHHIIVELVERDRKLQARLRELGIMP